MHSKTSSNTNQAQALLHSRRVSALLVLSIVAGILLTACGGNRTNQGNIIPGKEEFGMTKDQLVTNIEAVEALISQCMRDAGFEYIAADYSTVRRGMVADKSLPGMG